MIEIVAGVVIGGLIAFAVRMLADLHRRRVERMYDFRGKFFAAAERVLDQDRVADTELSALREMTREIGNPRSFDALLRAVISIETKARMGDAAATPLRYPDEWYPVLLNYFMALSYLKGIRGIYLRSLLAALLDPSTGNRNVEIIDRRIHAGHLQAV
jgi:hypothetical protein